MNIEKLLKLFLLLSTFFTISNAKTYYVSVDGNNSSIGSFKKPFRTIKKGATALNCGDRLIVKSGVYRESRIKLRESGLADRPIIIEAEENATVYLYGTREKNMLNGGGVGFFIDKSYVTIDGFYFENYDTGVYINKATSVTVQKSTFKNGGESGVTTVDSTSPKIKNCRFIGELLPDKQETAIQDYAVVLYFTKGAVVEDNYIYGAHNQSISFKEDCHNGVARRNIIEGVLYTAIYLGQNKRKDSGKLSTNLTAEYNIVREASGYRVKSPIRVDNVKNVTIAHNYLEGFDKTNNTAGVHIFSEALGKIKIYDNIIAFAVNNSNSAGIHKEINTSKETIVEIENNTLYNVAKDFVGTLDNSRSYFKNNIAQAYSDNYYRGRGYSNNYQGSLELEFKNGTPKKQAISDAPRIYNFQNYYNRLIDSFFLKKGSRLNGKGYRFK